MNELMELHQSNPYHEGDIFGEVNLLEETIKIYM